MTSEKRTTALDVLRVLSVILVMTSHTVYALFDKGNAGGFLPYLFGTIGQLGVTIFIVISGYLAAHSLRRDQALAFYKKRLASILPPIWISSLTIGTSFFILAKMFGVHAPTVFETIITSQPLTEKIDFVRLLWSVLGIDGYLHVSRYGIEVYNIVTEWFIGFVLLLLVFAPIIDRLVRSYGTQTLVIALVASVLSFYWPRWEGPLSVFFVSFGNTLNPPVRIFEFVFGFFLFHRREDRSFWRVGRIIAASYVLILLGIYFSIGANFMVRRVEGFVFGCCFVLLAFDFINTFCRDYAGMSLISGLAKKSFMAMLIHHPVVYLLCNNLPSIALNSLGVLTLFGIVIISSFYIAGKLVPVSAAITRLLLASSDLLNMAGKGLGATIPDRVHKGARDGAQAISARAGTSSEDMNRLPMPR